MSYTLVKITKSNKQGKKMMAVFKNNKSGREKTTHFGASGMDDYLKTKDKAQRDRYRARTKSVYNKSDPISASRLAGDILWGDSTSLNENIKSYKKKYNL